MTPERKITCTNEDGVSLVLTDRFSPFLLLKCDGIYGFTSKNAMSENTMTDGSTAQGSRVTMRDIVLYMVDRANHKINREFLYKCFKPKSYGTFLYEEDGDKKSINYLVQDVDIGSEERAREAVITLECPDPFFVDLEDLTVTMAGWEGGWTFAHIFKEEGEPFAVRTVEKLKTITNDSAADNIGITITLTTQGAVTNPSVYRVESGEYIKVGTTANPFEMEAGDVLIITTGTNNKHVYLEREAVKTEVNQYLSEDSEYIQLMRGNNTIGYEAESGEEYLMVDVSYRYRYLGV